MTISSHEIFFVVNKNSSFLIRSLLLFTKVKKVSHIYFTISGYYIKHREGRETPRFIKFPNFFLFSFPQICNNA